MHITLLWETATERQLKNETILGMPAFEYTKMLFSELAMPYQEELLEKSSLVSAIQENRIFSVRSMLPETPVLYFVGHYPALPTALIKEFIKEAKGQELAVLYTPSLKWQGEREILCVLWQPDNQSTQRDRTKEAYAFSRQNFPIRERTLAMPITRLWDRKSIPQVEKELSLIKNRRLMEAGVVIVDESTVKVDWMAEVEEGVILHPMTFIRGKSRVGKASVLGPNCELTETYVGERNRILQSYLEKCEVASDCNIGPFSYIRPDAKIGNRVRIGDFVEIKNSIIGDDTMISHLTYVGDADVGSHVNFGCGTILVNFDGKTKHRSKIEDHAFIGCNSNLVSPVHIGKNAFIAAGSTITNDLPENSLGIARAKQQMKENWVTNRNVADEGGKNK